MRLNEIQLELLSEKLGQDVRTPAGASNLSLDIESKTGQSLSVNTIKRLVGVLKDEVKPNKTTLNIIANYLGFPAWEILRLGTSVNWSSFGRMDVFLDMTNMHFGSKVEICWRPDRRILLQNDGVGQYTVLESENSKLRPGDILSLSKLAIGYPFIADKVFRDEKPLGGYRAADGAGIISIDIL